MRIIRAADCKVMPWKNGGGTTTEIAVSPASATMDNFDWRVSMAHVGADGPFSSFPGIDRTLSVLSGNAIRLAFDDGETVTLDPASAPFAFAADRAVDGRLIAGPIDDLNVMSRRGAWTHRVARLTGGSHEVAAETGLLLLVAPEGGWAVDQEVLAAGDAALAKGPGEITCASNGDGTVLFSIRLQHI